MIRIYKNDRIVYAGIYQIFPKKIVVTIDFFLLILLNKRREVIKINTLITSTGVFP
jgi:hypothetical protein